MSYILEALKKSQAERQLGELPTIHAPQVQLQGNSAASAARRTPAWLALGGMSVVVAAALWWWQPWLAAAPVLGPASAAVSAAVPALAVAALPAAVLSATAALPAASPSALPAPARAPTLAAIAPAPRVEPAPLPAPKREIALAPVPAPAPAPAAIAAAAPPAATLPVDEAVPAMRDLPEPIQRQIPPIAIGGYIYSKNPSDRLLLIDKVLRHEGEELAPGLVLEKLQPKAAIFSFKGYRYRVPY